MLRFLVSTALLAFFSSGTLLGQNSRPAQQKESPIPVVKLAPQKTGPALPALKYRFLPDPRDQVPGNAAPFWWRAGVAARSVRIKYDAKHWTWDSAGDTSLQALPRKEVREYLSHYTTALQLAEEAARRLRCDWETPPPTVQDLSRQAFDDVQTFRELAHLFSTRCRLQLAEGNFEQAVHTLQVGFTLARHVGDSDTLIEYLVGAAIAGIMLGRVEEMMQIPGSPNLYWALTQLPSPLVDCRRAFGNEQSMLVRSFPQIRQLPSGPMTVEQINVLVDDFTKAFGSVLGRGNPPPVWTTRVGLTALAIKVYPDAKKALLARGRTAEQIDAMPALQVVVLQCIDEYDEFIDEYLKRLALPPWQMWPALESIERRIREFGRGRNPLIDLLMPAGSKVLAARLRQDWQMAGLRTAEALRGYAAAHDGRPPEKLSDITAVPLPLNPYSGRSFDTEYAVKDGMGILDLPAPREFPVAIGRRFELAARSGK